MQDYQVDPVTLEVVRHQLDGIANEMEMTLLKSSFSPIVKEGLDASASLFTADGTTLAQACAVPVHLATLIPAVAMIRKTFPARDHEGGRRLSAERSLLRWPRTCRISPSSSRSSIAAASSPIRGR